MQPPPDLSLLQSVEMTKLLRDGVWIEVRVSEWRGSVGFVRLCTRSLHARACFGGGGGVYVGVFLCPF